MAQGIVGLSLTFSLEWCGTQFWVTWKAGGFEVWRGGWRGESASLNQFLGVTERHLIFKLTTALVLNLVDKKINQINLKDHFENQRSWVILRASQT